MSQLHSKGGVRARDPMGPHLVIHDPSSRALAPSRPTAAPRAQSIDPAFPHCIMSFARIPLATRNGTCRADWCSGVSDEKTLGCVWFRTRAQEPSPSTAAQQPISRPVISSDACYTRCAASRMWTPPYTAGAGPAWSGQDDQHQYPSVGCPTCPRSPPHSPRAQCSCM